MSRISNTCSAVSSIPHPSTPILALAPPAAPRQAPPLPRGGFRTRSSQTLVGHAKIDLYRSSRRPGAPRPQDIAMRIENDVKLDFKDVLIRPKRSTLNSRNEVDIARSFRFYHTGPEWKGFPLIAANMDVTGTMAMARALGKHGALTALHKHYPEPKLAEFFAEPDGAHAFYSLGTTAADVKKLAAVAKAAPVRFICLDVANGYAEKFLETVKRVRDD